MSTTMMRVRSKNSTLMTQALAILEVERPMTLRQLFYRLVSAGAFPNAPKEYKRLGGLMTRLREEGYVPRTWIVDHIRSTDKPGSWSGLADFGEVVRDAYRKNFWPTMPHHVEVFVEKDAIAGTIQPITREYDVSLHVVRGYSSVSFAGEIAAQWAEIKKPIFAYYLGDFDPSGFDIERDLYTKLERYSGRIVFPMPRVDAEHTACGSKASESKMRNVTIWSRLAVEAEDFDLHDLVRLPAKQSDNRTKGFVEQHGEHCAEVDAIAPTELRRRVREAIEQHVDQDGWERLKLVEELERKTLLENLAWLGSEKVNLGSVSENGGEA